MIKAVVKIGGSLLKKNRLNRLCENLGRIGTEHSIIVVPGGGPFADTVRSYQKSYRLSDDAAHWMAILAMDQYGHFLCDLIKGSQTVQSLPEAQKISASGRVPILLPFDIIYRADPLPHNWSVTSDAISAWIAQQVRASMLVLLKSIDGLYAFGSCRTGERKILEKISIKQLAACKAVDPYLSEILNVVPHLHLWIINGRRAERIVELMHEGWTLGTQLIQSVP